MQTSAHQFQQMSRRFMHVIASVSPTETSVRAELNIDGHRLQAHVEEKKPRGMEIFGHMNNTGDAWCVGIGEMVCCKFFGQRNRIGTAPAAPFQAPCWISAFWIPGKTVKKMKDAAPYLRLKIGRAACL